jgi:predicted ATPase/class 3 adenylate cyclase
VAEQPEAAYTFLFTDIVGSTRLWEDHPDEMGTALARHNELLRRAIDQHAGSIFKTMGDGVYSSFHDGGDALAAAIAAQRSLGAEPWPSGLGIRVRMGLHSGVCAEQEGDFFGPVINRTSRLHATAHGGQVVLSEATAGLVRHQLPEGAALRDLGQHRLKDLGRPERIFELMAPGLETGFPPLQSLESPDLPNNLPEQVSTFIGRETELAEIRQLIERGRLVTLVGAGGAGKTRLALQVAAEMVDGSGGGVWYVELATISDPELVMRMIASALGLREESGRPLVETVTDALAARNVLLVIDNCEHLITSVAQAAHQLLRACPGLHVLATSQQPLGIEAEWVYRVPSLAVPPPHATGAMVRFDAVQFFVHRAQQRQKGFVVDEANLPLVIDLCRRLDGIPLAMELAAVRLDTLSLTEVHQRLDDRFRLLTGGSRTALARQQTLQATVDWSYELLSELEGLVLCHLSVFAGGFTIESAQAMFAGDAFEQFDVVETVRSLSAKSLVEADSGDDTRFHLNETIRHYAAERLVARGASTHHAAREAHARVFLALVERAAPELIGAEQRVWLELLEVERDNLRVAMSYLLGASARHEQALRFGVSLRRFWHARGYWGEGHELLVAALALPGAHAPRHLRALALNAAGQMCVRRSDHATGVRHYEEALQLGQVLHDEAVIAESLAGLAWFALAQGRRADAVPLVDQALEHARTSGNRQIIGLVLERRASIDLDDLERSRTDYAEALEQLRAVHDLFSIGIVENNMADLELLVGNAEEARRHLDAAIAICHELDDKSVVYCYLNLGTAGVLTGDHTAARNAYLLSLHGAQRTGDQFIIANSVLGIALCESAEGHEAAAAELHGVADGLLAALGGVLEVTETKLHDEDQQKLRANLGDEAFSTLHAAGLALDATEGVARAVQFATPS